jgi:hypothetical protein
MRRLHVNDNLLYNATLYAKGFVEPVHIAPLEAKRLRDAKTEANRQDDNRSKTRVVLTKLSTFSNNWNCSTDKLRVLRIGFEASFTLTNSIGLRAVGTSPRHIA